MVYELTRKVEWEEVKCALCNTNDTTLLFVAKERLFGIPGEFPIVRCKQCGLVYVNPRPNRQTMADFYPSEYVPHGQVTSQKGYRVGVKLWHAYTRLFLHNIDLLEDIKPSRVLDVGTGSGEYLLILREKGWDPVGVEPAHNAAALAIKKGIQVYQGEIHDVGFPDQSFGAVTFRGSLEHIHDPLEALRETERVLQDDGVVLIEVPNFRCPEVRIFGRWWTPIEAPRHLYHFTKETLTAMLKRAGFSVVRTEHQYCYRSAVDSLS